MEYNFTEKEESLYVNDFYKTYFLTMQKTIMNSHCNAITKLEARKQREIYKKKFDNETKFASTLIGKMLVRLGVKSPYRKYEYKQYDLMLLIMRYLNKEVLYMTDFANFDVKDFYVKCLKKRYDRLLEFEEEMKKVSLSENEKIKVDHEKHLQMYKNLIPTEEELERTEKDGLKSELKMKWILKSSNRDNKIIDDIKEDLSKIYELEPGFIVYRYNRLWRVVQYANCSEEERTKMMNFIGSAYGKVRAEERKEKNGYKL